AVHLRQRPPDPPPGRRPGSRGPDRDHPLADGDPGADLLAEERAPHPPRRSRRAGRPERTRESGPQERPRAVRERRRGGDLRRLPPPRGPPPPLSSRGRDPPAACRRPPPPRAASPPPPRLRLPRRGRADRSVRIRPRRLAAAPAQPGGGPGRGRRQRLALAARGPRLEIAEPRLPTAASERPFPLEPGRPPPPLRVRLPPRRRADAREPRLPGGSADRAHRVGLRGPRRLRRDPPFGRPVQPLSDPRDGRVLRARRPLRGVRDPGRDRLPLGGPPPAPPPAGGRSPADRRRGRPPRLAPARRLDARRLAPLPAPAQRRRELRLADPVDLPDRRRPRPVGRAGDRADSPDPRARGHLE